MDLIMQKILILPGIVIGISFHEFAHAFVAYRLGDDTPKIQGRVTLNPLAHLDPIGFICLFLIGFGWGRPVQINPYNFKKVRRDNLLVSLAGVTMNLLIAIGLMAIMRLIYSFSGGFLSTELGAIVQTILFAAVSINLVLMIFNLLPVPPLDGFSVLTEVFNLRAKPAFYNVYRYGPIILLLLIAFNVTELILSPLVGFFYQLLFNIFF